MPETARYFGYLADVLAQTARDQAAGVQAAAAVIADGFAAGRKFYAFGTGHSHMVAEELYMRAGGLAFVKGILPGEMMLHQMPHKSTLLERMPGYAAALLDLYGPEKGDALLIVSNSGTNSVPVEMALGARARGVHVIAITSLKHSRQVSARHESGQKLYQIADIVLDNQTEYGDAAFRVAGCDVPTGPISDFVGIALAQALVVAVTEKLVQKGIEPPILRSANVDGADEYNKRYRARYFSGGY